MPKEKTTTRKTKASKADVGGKKKKGMFHHALYTLDLLS